MIEQQFNPQESLQLIDDMIRKAKSSYHQTGIGPILWGTVVSCCALISWSQMEFDFALPFDIWLLTVVAIIPQIVITQREKKQRMAVNYEDKALGYIWTTFGISMFLLSLIVNYTFHNLYIKVPESTDVFGDIVTSFFLLVYGIPTIITGGIMRFKYMLWGGIICWCLIIPSLFVTGKTDMLLTALAAISAWLVPGIILRVRHLKKQRSGI